ncbi:hypothetical protein D0B54_04960 [Solimonas sp. K1W22B-7]|uniref:hypothetical protein n=1 Tax=Solimonas sp. K1W22B-7 TaxID=2303331 RepID=UPI000E32DFAB|nr:hypothetical protein [Solimonas sp. K1W22B-7]AXQ28063.1 hypothetical protein D0B54_04960 [Solimonas sp. K1W22B-7]
MNYGMDDVLSGWGGVARAANPGPGMRTAMERSAFADLFDSDVHFAALAGAAAAAATTAPAASARPIEPSVGADHGVAATATNSEVVAVAEVSPDAAPSAQDRVGAALPTAASAGVVRPAVVADAGPARSVAVRTTLDPALYQWSRTGFSACLHGGELDISVRDGELHAARDLANALRRALGDMGLELGKLKINGINPGS